MHRESEHPPPKNRLIRLPEVESITGSKKSTIYKLMKDGSFPQPVRLSRRLVAWSEVAVQGWVHNRMYSRDSSLEQRSLADVDRTAALRASEEVRIAKFRDLAAHPRRCINCGAGAPSHLEEGESPPCGCP